MSRKYHIGLHKLYASDPIKADKLLWGRETDSSRRGFLKKAGLTAMSLMLGAEIVYARYMPAGLIPAWLFHSDDNFQIEGKHKGLIVLNDRPLNAETPPHLLDDAITPLSRLFVRNNGIPPTVTNIDKWSLKISGESVKKETTADKRVVQNSFRNPDYSPGLDSSMIFIASSKSLSLTKILTPITDHGKVKGKRLDMFSLVR